MGILRRCGDLLPARINPTDHEDRYGNDHQCIRKKRTVPERFWCESIALAGLVQEQVVDTATAERIIGMIAGVLP
jgi:hypothetical protein